MNSRRTFVAGSLAAMAASSLREGTEAKRKKKVAASEVVTEATRCRRDSDCGSECWKCTTNKRCRKRNDGVACTGGTCQNGACVGGGGGGGATFTAHIYDFTTKYSAEVKSQAAYYGSVLAPHIEVIYHRMPEGLTAPECDTYPLPTYGVRQCEELHYEPEWTASSTGMNWVPVGSDYELNSTNIYFSGLTSDFVDSISVCHETGHSFNLYHTYDANDPNCLYVNADVSDQITPWQVQYILDSRPGFGPPTGR